MRGLNEEGRRVSRRPSSLLTGQTGVSRRPSDPGCGSRIWHVRPDTVTPRGELRAHAGVGGGVAGADRVGSVGATRPEHGARDVSGRGVGEERVVAGDVLAALDAGVRGRERVEQRAARPLARREAGVVVADLEVAERDVGPAQDLDAVLVGVADPPAAVGTALDLQVGRARPGVRQPNGVLAGPVRAPVAADVEDQVGCGGAVTDAAGVELHGTATGGRAVVRRVEHHDAQRETVGRVVPDRPGATPDRVGVRQRRAAARRRGRRGTAAVAAAAARRRSSRP